MTTEIPEFIGTYDAAGHRQDVIDLLQGGKLGKDLLSNTTIVIHPMRSLTVENVREIRATYQRSRHGYGYTSIAQKYGVNREVVRGIINGKTYKEVA